MFLFVSLDLFWKHFCFCKKSTNTFKLSLFMGFSLLMCLKEKYIFVTYTNKSWDSNMDNMHASHFKQSRSQYCWGFQVLKVCLVVSLKYILETLSVNTYLFACLCFLITLFYRLQSKIACLVFSTVNLFVQVFAVYFACLVWHVCHLGITR